MASYTQAATEIAQLWTPDIWIRGLTEKMRHFPALVNSPIVKRTPEFDSLAGGGGITINIPYFRDITDQADAPQVENTEPAYQAIGSGKQIAPICNRETANNVTALAAAVSGSEPVEEIVGQLARRRLKQRQLVMENILAGIFGFSNAPGGAGALQANRNDVFSETGANPGANQLISTFNVVDTIALLGELADTTMGGGIFMHPTIRASLIKQDQIAFTHYSQQSGTLLTGEVPGNGAGMVEYYKGYRVFVSVNLVRAANVSGFVFATYIFAPGVFAWGEKPQVGGPLNQPVIDVASLNYWAQAPSNVANIYDRTRFILHPNGMRWVGFPAGQSAANAEFATAANWNLDYETADRTGIVCIRSNG